jgi:hypothetical protein
VVLGHDTDEAAAYHHNVESALLGDRHGGDSNECSFREWEGPAIYRSVRARDLARESQMAPFRKSCGHVVVAVGMPASAHVGIVTYNYRHNATSSLSVGIIYLTAGIDWPMYARVPRPILTNTRSLLVIQPIHACI